MKRIDIILLVNTHTHSTISDGREKPEAMIREYRKCGYDAVIMTDHRNKEMTYNYPDVSGIIVIEGCEMSDGEHYTYAEAGEESIKIKNHPNRYHDSVNEIEEWNLYECTEHSRLQPEYLKCRGNYPITSDDAHSLQDIGNAGILVEAKREKVDILKNIKSGNFRLYLNK